MAKGKGVVSCKGKKIIKKIDLLDNRTGKIQK